MIRWLILFVNLLVILKIDAQGYVHSNINYNWARYQLFLHPADFLMGYNLVSNLGKIVQINGDVTMKGREFIVTY